MRKLIFFMHTSLDSFVAGPNGEMNWINVNETMFDFIATMTAQADTALYGRVTYEMMEGYWPTAGDAPDADAHAKSHARWYGGVKKLVASRTLPASKSPNVRVVGEDIVGALRAEKQKAGGDIM